MPSTSPAQAKLMSAIAHGWHAPMKHAPSLAVAQEFHEADKRVGKYMHADGGKVSNLRNVYKYLQDLSEKYLNQLDPKDQHAVQLYQHAGDVLNEHLRGAPDHPPYSGAEELAPLHPNDPSVASNAELVARLDRIIREGPKTPEDVTLYRGMQRIQQPTPQPGYLSTSASRQAAKDYGPLQRVQVGGGTPALATDLNPDWLDLPQREVILPRGGLLTPTDKDMVQYSKADGGKVGTLVNFAKQGTKALMDRLEGSFHNPYTANTDQVRDDIAKYWRTNAPPPRITPPEPQLQRVDTSELEDLVNKPPTVPGLAEGGAVDDAPATSRFLGLVRHAADRTTATVSDDPHHALARVAAGLSSQVAGLSPSGHAQFGRRPGLVDETMSIPAGLTDLGKGAVDVSGAVADRLPPQFGGTTARAVSALRDGLNRLQEKYGDLAPKWSRDAEARSTQLHNSVHQDMGLSDPKGFVENGAEAGGMMLGQLPIPGSQAKEAATGLRGTLQLLKHAVPEWLGPTIRPSVRNYGAGALAGGLMGAAGGGSDDGQPTHIPPPDPDSSSPTKEQFE
jgi:hypothetical protein